ncbi:hypothetical protein JK364_23020 [Streptomyces sp. 110]|uniref:Secreted protein n=1 Tax=Streptomyces endocoffeicus TaxID=2898945 RepID=A0ABS1PS35_9ACTN|nr:hypothetical protein [Streptomyces endocoffeicus]MBL1115247.1 hypothetical protein [Streptomyces endocoffeicus]
MPTLKRTAAAAVITTIAVAGTALVTVPSASAASGYKCTTSKKSIDDPSRTDPFPDNWDFTAKVCARRSGQTISTYAKISWDGPNRSTTYDPAIFDGAYFQLQGKKSTAGRDPILKKANYNIESRLEHSRWGTYNSSFTTSVLRYKVGRAKGRGDGSLRLNWNHDGDGYKAYNPLASPVV